MMKSSVEKQVSRLVGPEGQTGAVTSSLRRNLWLRAAVGWAPTGKIANFPLVSRAKRQRAACGQNAKAGRYVSAKLCRRVLPNELKNEFLLTGCKLTGGMHVSIFD
jgi:hypothetical protein